MPVPERIHDEYVEFVLQELKLRAEGKKFNTIYLGGGSPSILSEKNLQKILNALNTPRQHTPPFGHPFGIGECHHSKRGEEELSTVFSNPFSILHSPFSIPNLEFTMEWNPEQVSDEKIKIARDFGVNRFSLGIQSLNDDLLKVIGRRHNAKEALNAFEKLNSAFDTGSCDLMFCLPRQTTEDFLNDVKMMIDKGAKHLSFYGLKSERMEGNEDLYPEMYLKAAEILNKAGLERYEISNFAKAGHESKHNLAYWKGGEYLGVGPSAHSFLNGVRVFFEGKYSAWKKWVLAGCPKTALTEDIPSEEGKKLESAWLALRTREGIDAEEIDMKKAEPYIKKRWLELCENKIRLKGDGWLWLDKLILEIL